MNVETLDDWHSWFSDLGLSKDTIQKYAEAFVAALVTKGELAELDHQALKDLDVTHVSHRLKIIKKAKTGKAGPSTSPPMVAKADAIPISVNQQSPAQGGLKFDGARINTVINYENPASSPGTGNVNDVTSDTTNKGAGNDSATTVNNTNNGEHATNIGVIRGNNTNNINK